MFVHLTNIKSYLIGVCIRIYTFFYKWSFLTLRFIFWNNFCRYWLLPLVEIYVSRLPAQGNQNLSVYPKLSEAYPWKIFESRGSIAGGQSRDQVIQSSCLGNHSEPVKKLINHRQKTQHIIDQYRFTVAGGGIFPKEGNNNLLKIIDFCILMNSCEKCV